MQHLLSSNWFKLSAGLTLVAVALTFAPLTPVAILGGAALLTILPGAQLARWLGLYQGRWTFEAVALSLTLGMVTSPLLIYWNSLLFGFQRELLLVIFALYIIILAGYLARHDTLPNTSPLSIIHYPLSIINYQAVLLIGLTAVGVYLAYFEVETAQGYYPVQMEDWQKHYGVAFALRQTGVPPTSMFFYGLFPNDPLVYYYFLHLNGAALDLWQSGPPALHHTFVVFIVLASLCFSSIFFILARAMFNDQRAAVWGLAFATVIGGLDVIPILHRAITKYRENFPDSPLPAGLFLPREHVDNWVSALSLRLNTFFAHHIWVPQHLTGLTILCLGCYLYLKVKDRRKLPVILPLLLFALLGHSTWIAAVVNGCLFLFALRQIIGAYRRDGLIAARALFLGYALIAALFVMVAAPFILTLVGPHAPQSGLAFEIPRLDSWWILRPFQATFGPTIWARLLDLPLHFFIELGALLVAGLSGIILYRRDTRTSSIPSAALRTNIHHSSLITHHLSLFPFWILLLVAGGLTVIFFASGRSWAEMGLVLNNDLGLRAIMAGQATLALFAGYFMARLPALSMPRYAKAPLVTFLGILIALGVAYAGWEFTSMGIAKYFSGPQLSPDEYLTLRALPGITAAQDKPLPVVQHRLHRNASRFQLSLGGRPVGFSTGEAVVFHQDVEALALAHELSRAAFDNGLSLRSYQLFHNLGADYIFVGPAERDPIRHPQKYQHSQYFQHIFRQGDYEIYRVEPLPFEQNKILAQFDDGAIEFQGHFLDLTPIYPGDTTLAEVSGKPGATAGLVTAWRLTRPAAKNYTVFIHFVDSGGNIVAQADHQLWAWDVNSEGPTSTWTPKLLHLDIAPMPPMALTGDKSVTIRLGLWLPDTGQQFPPQTKMLDIDGDGRLVINPSSR
jgi:hypothetical protein